jgi:hypothetical protein
MSIIRTIINNARRALPPISARGISTATKENTRTSTTTWAVYLTGTVIGGSVLYHIYSQINLKPKDIYMKECSGKRFNWIHKGRKFYKITNSEEDHKGFQYKDGLNVDTIQFYPNEACEAGGLYFSDDVNFVSYLLYGPHIREVTIPDDARVYSEKDKYKADKIVLGPRCLIEESDVWKDIDLCEERVKLNGMVIKYVKNQTDTMQRNAVQKSPGAYMYMVNPTYETQKFIAKHKPFAFAYNINIIDKNLQDIAVFNAPHMIMLIENPSEELQNIAVKEFPYVYGYIKNPCKSVTEFAMGKERR